MSTGRPSYTRGRSRVISGKLGRSLARNPPAEDLHEQLAGHADQRLQLLHERHHRRRGERAEEGAVLEEVAVERHRQAQRELAREPGQVGADLVHGLLRRGQPVGEVVEHLPLQTLGHVAAREEALDELEPLEDVAALGVERL